MGKRMTAGEIELALNHWLSNERLAVPNVSWGLRVHECDILTLSRSGYATEIEIKVSKSDLKRDADKDHGHRSQRIKYLYFAMPEAMRDCIGDVPEHAGIVLVSTDKYGDYQCQIIREPQPNVAARKFTDTEAFALARLGALRIWPLKWRVWELELELEYLIHGHNQDQDYSI